MPSPFAPVRPSAALVGMLLAAALGGAGCATAQPIDWHVVGRTAVVAEPGLAGRIAAVGGVPVAGDEVAPLTAGWVAFTLQCADEAHCQQAMSRLTAEPQLFVELRRDELRKIPQRPSGASTR